MNQDIRDAHYSLANAYLNAGAHEVAITHFQKALEEDPDFLDGYHALALAYFGAHDVAAAETAVRSALKRDDTYQPARALLAALAPSVLVSAEQSDGSADSPTEAAPSPIDVHQEPKQTVPPPVESENQSETPPPADGERVETDIDKEKERGLAFLGTQQYPQAEAAFKKVIKANPHDPQAHYNLAQTYLETGALTSAKRTVEAALRISPSYAPAVELKKAMTYHIQQEKRQRRQQQLIRYLLPVVLLGVAVFCAIHFGVVSFPFLEKSPPALSIDTSLEDPRNNNGEIDAGETVRLKVTISNRGSAAKHLSVHLTPKTIGGVRYEVPKTPVTVKRNGFHTLRIPFTADKRARTRKVPITIQVLDKNQSVLATTARHLSIKGN
ncbi:hypothetical protein C6499_04220 [Candidatus Poribacteria bacterium]|nr:MAG: hypothetical protein C6499_04220 [Candidatus Poribacteria bacterium]